MTFFSKLNFSSSNEDGASELAALCAAPPRRLVCLTGSGTRVFDMLLGNPGEVIALDLNPFQNELLRLKMAAFDTLNDTELFAYLGLSARTGECEQLHLRVAAALTESSRAFWAKNIRLIHNGIWYSGLWERVLRLGARGTRLIRGRHIGQLFAATSLEEQAEIWRRHFDDWIWRTSIRTLGRRWFWTHVIGEPGGALIPSPTVVEARLRGSFNHASQSFFFRDSDFASLILRGRHEGPRAIPLHLQSGNTDLVRARLNRIRIVQGGLDTLTGSDIRDADAFSLSDFGSYCTQEAHDACWRGIHAVAAPGARVCEREFLNALPFARGVAWDEALSSRLTATDKSFIYRIRAGVIGSAP